MFSFPGLGPSVVENTRGTNSMAPYASGKVYYSNAGNQPLLSREQLAGIAKGSTPPPPAWGLPSKEWSNWAGQQRAAGVTAYQNSGTWGRPALAAAFQHNVAHPIGEPASWDKTKMADWLGGKYGQALSEGAGGDPSSNPTGNPASPFGATGGEYSRMRGWANRNLPPGLVQSAGRTPLQNAMPAQVGGANSTALDRLGISRVPYFWRIFGAAPPARMPGSTAATTTRSSGIGQLPG